MWKETVVAYCEILSRQLSDGLYKTTKISLRVAGLQAES
jgi:hypothetical protein